MNKFYTTTVRVYRNYGTWHEEYFVLVTSKEILEDNTIISIAMDDVMKDNVGISRKLFHAYIYQRNEVDIATGPKSFIVSYDDGDDA